MLALVLYVGRADAGVTIETIKEGDGVNFPTVGKSIKVCISERFHARTASGSFCKERHERNRRAGRDFNARDCCRAVQTCLV